MIEILIFAAAALVVLGAVVAVVAYTDYQQRKPYTE